MDWPPLPPSSPPSRPEDDRHTEWSVRPRCASSDDDELDSPSTLGDVGVRVVGGALLGGDGGVVRHVDSFVRSTRRCGRADRPDEPIDPSDDEGSPRSRRLTFEFRNFNLYPDPRDGERSPGLLEKRRPSRSLDIREDPAFACLASPTFSAVAPHDAPYYAYGHMTRSQVPSLPVISASPVAHPYRSIHSTRPAPNLRRNSDVGPSYRPSGEHREKRVVTLREAIEPAPTPTPTPSRVQHQPDDDASSELSEPEDADGPSKSGGDSSVTSGGGTRQHQQQQQRRKPTRARKKKPYKSRRCDICNKTFTKECDVTRHRRTAHGEDEIEFKCHECGRLFNRKDALERHYKVYEGTPHVARRYQPKTYLGQKK